MKLLKFYIIFLVLFGFLGTNAIQIPTVQSQTPQKAATTKSNSAETSNPKFSITQVKINIDRYTGSGTLVSQNYFAQSGELAQAGLVTTIHLFQNPKVKQYLEQNGAINLSASNTMKCNYSFGESLEYAVFIPIKLVDELIQNYGLKIASLGQNNLDQSFIDFDFDPNLQTEINGAVSGQINLQQKIVSKGDSGSLLYQINQFISPLGIQFGFAKNTDNPLTIFWQFYKNKANKLESKVTWLDNINNQIIWQDKNYIPSNCGRVEQNVKLSPKQNLKLRKI